jgi:hypothetical protein
VDEHVVLFGLVKPKVHCLSNDYSYRTVLHIFPCLLVGSITQVSALKHLTVCISLLLVGHPTRAHRKYLVLFGLVNQGYKRFPNDFPFHAACAYSLPRGCAPRHPTYCFFLLLVGPPTKPTENLVCLEFLVQLATCSMHAGRKASSL